MTRCVRRWLLSGIVSIALSLMCSTVASAQVSQDLELNVFAAFSGHTKNGYVIGAPQSLTPVEGSFSLDQVIRSGMRANVYTRGHWGQEFYYSFEQSDVHIARITNPKARVDLPIQIHNLGINALYYFSDDEQRRTRPFVSAGLGAMIYRPTPEAKQIALDPFGANLGDFDQSNELTFNYGAGVKTRVTSRFGLRLDVRGFLNRNPSFGFPRRSDDPNAVILPTEGAIHSIEASVGIILYLGRR